MTSLACDNHWMADSFDIGALRRNLTAAMDRKRVKPTTLSLKVGRSPTLVKDLLEKTDDTKLSTIYRLAEALGIPATELLEGGVEVASLGPKLFVKGEVAAGNWVEAFEWPHDEWQTMTGRADINVDPMHRFFLRIVGDSMNLVYPEGSFIECVSLIGGGKVAPGKRVVVIRRRHDQLIEATVKELVDIDGVLWFAPRSTNPAHQAFRADEPGDGIEEVSMCAVVVSSVRPE